MKAFENYDYHKLVRLLLRDLRGTATQKQMSSRLGYSYNQWHKWESGQKRLMWNNLEVIASELKLNLDHAKRLVVNQERTVGAGGRNFILAIIENYGGPNSILAKKKLNLSRAKLYRLKHSKQDVEVGFVFDCIGKLSSTLPGFVDELLKKVKGTAFRDAIQLVKNQVALEVEYPWICLIEACLELDAYKKLPEHSDEFIAKRLGFPIKQVKVELKKLIDSKSIFLKDSKYHLDLKRVDLSRVEDASRFYKFWTDVCGRRFMTSDGVPHSRAGFAGRVVPISDAAHKEISNLRLKFFDDLNKVFQSDGDRPKGRIMVLVQHILDDQEIKHLRLLDYL